jgi:hypothetical protein
VPLDLAEAFDLTYRLGRFAMIVRHDRPLLEEARLGPEDRRWAEALGR